MAFIFGLILIGLSVAIAFLYKTENNKFLKHAAMTVLTVLGICFITGSMIAVVGTNKVAIVTSMNKPTDALGAGWHGKKPWEKTTEFDGTRQTLRFEGKGNDKDDNADDKVWPCFGIKIENNATACINGIAAWQLKVDSKDKAELAAQKERAKQLFLNYRSFSRVIRDYIRPSAQSALQATYDDVNPLIPEKNPSYATLSTEMQNAFKSVLGVEIDVLFVQITNADWDPKTDNAIEQQQEQVAKTAQALEKKKTNEAEAAAAAALTVNNGKPVDPDYALKNKCMDIAREQNKDPGPCLQPGYGGILGPPQPK